MCPTLVIISHLSSKLTAKATATTKKMHGALSFDFYQTSTYNVYNAQAHQARAERCRVRERDILIFRFDVFLTLIWNISKKETMQQQKKVSNFKQFRDRACIECCVPNFNSICRFASLFFLQSSSCCAAITYSHSSPESSVVAYI